MKNDPPRACVRGVFRTHEPLGVRGERYRHYRLCDMFTLFHLRWLASRARQRSWNVLDVEFKGRRSIIVCLLVPEGAQNNEHLKAAVDLTLTADALLLGHA